MDNREHVMCWSQCPWTSSASTDCELWRGSISIDRPCIVTCYRFPYFNLIFQTNVQLSPAYYDIARGLLPPQIMRLSQSEEGKREIQSSQTQVWPDNTAGQHNT
jgi:hypothetical protein